MMYGTILLTRCENHTYAVRNMDEARSMVELMRATLSRQTCAGIAALVAGGHDECCPAAAVAAHLCAAAWREIGCES